MYDTTISRRYISGATSGGTPGNVEVSVITTRPNVASGGAERLRTLFRVRTQRQVVDYALQRRALLAEVYSGRVGVMEVCDANPYLLRAAKFHGEPSAVTCPVCRKEPLTLVSWVYGDALKHAAGSARTGEELTRMATLFEEFSVYVVEVCRTCSWNHLVQSYVLGTPGVGSRRTRRRTAAE